MVIGTIGVDSEKPLAEQYDFFNDHFIQGLHTYDTIISLRRPDIVSYFGYLGYGSYFDKKAAIEHANSFVPGVSDVDGNLLLDDEFVTDKSRLEHVAQLYADALQVAPQIPMQISVIDSGSVVDGRFFPYDESFPSYFREAGHLQYGKDVRELIDEDNECIRSGRVSGRIAHNLKKMRGVLLQAELYRRHSYPDYLKQLRKHIFDNGSKFPKTLYSLANSFAIEPSVLRAASLADSLSSSVDSSVLSELICFRPLQNDVFLSTDEFDESYDLACRTVTFAEELVRSFCLNPDNPKVLP